MGNNEKGFSLFELIIVIAIISIMSVIAVPNFLAWRDSANLRGSAFNLKSDLEMAKMRAKRSGGNVAVTFAGTRCEIFQDSNGNFVKDAGETLVASREFPNIVLACSFGGSPISSSGSTGFNSMGQIASLKTGSATIDKVGSISLAMNNQTIIIDLSNKLGFIKIR